MCRPTVLALARWAAIVCLAWQSSALGECPDSFPSGCRCNLAITVAPEDESRRTVLCSRLTASDLADAEFLFDLPANTETVILRQSNLDVIPTARFLFGTDPRSNFSAPERPSWAQVRVLRVEDNVNTLQKIDVRTILCSFPQLEKLLLPNNTILETRVAFNKSCVQNLKLLALQQNHIHYLPNETLRVFEESPQLRVDLRDNTFSCDCNFVATHGWLVNAQENVVAPEKYACRDGYPESLAGLQVVDVQREDLACPSDEMAVGDGVSGFSPDESHFFTGLYSVIIIIGVVASFVALFALFMHFPFLLECVHTWNDPPLIASKMRVPRPKVLQNRYYTTLSSETPA